MEFRSTLASRTIWIGVAFALAFMVWQSTHSASRAQTPQAKVQDKPFVVEYYYKAKWGHADEFIRLFKKNHYPFLKKQTELGNALQVTAETPVNHGTEDGRWDYRIRIVWKNVQVAHDDSGDEQILKQLYPDQEAFKREEQRRFEILLAHWDVPIRAVNLDEK
ncbi:MAG: hypothetical protein ACR2H4_20915 [Pyrinomonadaceae bacterium]